MPSSTPTITVELEVPQPKTAHLDPRKTALVIIDMVNDFCTSEGVMSMSARRVAVVKPIKALLTRCRKAGMPVIHVQSIRDPDAPEFTRFGLKPFVLRNSWGAQITEELAPLPNEAVVEKNSHDCFNGTRMETVLAEWGINPAEWRIVVVGLGLTNCVGCAVTGFSVRHYQNVLLPMDCTASRTVEEDLCQYQRYLQNGYSYNVTLTRSDMLTIGTEKSAAVAA
jgi:nicotinamidase-related amidase